MRKRLLSAALVLALLLGMALQGARGLRNIATRYIGEPIIFLLLKREVLQTSAELVK